MYEKSNIFFEQQHRQKRVKSFLCTHSPSCQRRFIRRNPFVILPLPSSLSEGGSRRHTDFSIQNEPSVLSRPSSGMENMPQAARSEELTCSKKLILVTNSEKTVVTGFFSYTHSPSCQRRFMQRNPFVSLPLPSSLSEGGSQSAY